MSSQNASDGDAVKAPSRQRGRQRVAALLQAAGELFVEKGYDATTMTEIAARAGASIGSLYQFFPTKPLLAEAMHLQVLDELAGMIDGLADAVAPGVAVGEIAERLFDGLFAFVAGQPVFITLAERRDIDPARKARTRQDLLARIGALLGRASPAPAPARIEVMAILLLALMKTALSLRAEQGDGAAGRRLIAELRAMMSRHLAADGAAA